MQFVSSCSSLKAASCKTVKLRETPSLLYTQTSWKQDVLTEQVRTTKNVQCTLVNLQQSPTLSSWLLLYESIRHKGEVHRLDGGPADET